jgi:hypothetical protein
MKKLRTIFFISLLLISFVLAETNNEKVERYAEETGNYLLKIQETTLNFLKIFNPKIPEAQEYLLFAQVLLILVVFMIVYSVNEIFIGKFRFITSLIISILSFISISPEEIEMILYSYESLGAIISIIIPILVLLAFTFRIYQKAYEGKSQTSPFYAELFNFGFLIFFGIFFIIYSQNEPGAISSVRFIGGIILIILGFGQMWIFKLLANRIISIRKDIKRMNKEMSKARDEANQEMIKDLSTTN